MDVIQQIKYIIKRYYTIQQIKNKRGVVTAKSKLSIAGSFECGSNIVINSKGIDLCEKTHITVSNGATLKIGNYVGISQSSIFCKHSITIGNHVDIGAGCLIIDSDFHSTVWQDRIDRKKGVTNAKSVPITIADNVFVGARCIICKGVSIGARSIIAAGSVVVRDVPSDCIAGGNPCKVIKNL